MLEKIKDLSLGETIEITDKGGVLGLIEELPIPHKNVESLDKDETKVQKSIDSLRQDLRNSTKTEEEGFSSREKSEAIKEEIEGLISKTILELSEFLDIPLSKLKTNIEIKEIIQDDVEDNSAVASSAHKKFMTTPSYNFKTDKITINFSPDQYSKEITELEIFEEVAHMIREKTKVFTFIAPRDMEVDEFYGLLGQLIGCKIRYGDKKVEEFREQKKVEFHKKEEELKLDDLFLRELEQKIKNLESATKSDPLASRVEVSSLGIMLAMTRIRHIESKVHIEGYKNAVRIDLSQISNWKKLFKMRDKKVRNKFFGDIQDYT